MKIKELPMDQKTTITLLLTSIEEKETRAFSKKTKRIKYILFEQI